MFADIPAVHNAWAWVVVGTNAVVGLWALAAHWWAPARRTALWWAIGAAEVTIVIQVMLGVYMVAGEQRHPDSFHMFYGFVALITVAIIFAYRHTLRPWMYLLYGWGSLFLMGLALRAIVVRA